MRNYRAILFFSALLLAAIAAIFYGYSIEPTQDVQPDELSVLGDLEPVDTVTPDIAEQDAVQFIADRVGVEVILRIGAAGVYPPKKVTSSKAGYVAASEFEHDRDGAIEVLVQGVSSPSALWREWVDAPDPGTQIPLRSAKVLHVDVVDASGVPVVDANVRLGRDTVSLLWLDAVTDETGEALFTTIPPGDYVVHAEAKGRTGAATVAHLSTNEESSVEIVLGDAPSAIVGSVKDENGDNVSEATIVLIGSENQQPIDIVESNMFGQWEAKPSSIPASLVVRHPNFATKHVTLTGAIPSYDVVLSRGHRVNVTVSAPSRRPIARALVSWFDDAGFLGDSAVTDDAGVASFDSVPPGASFIARLGEQKSRTKKVTFKGEKPTDIALFLSNVDALTRPFRFRVRDRKEIAVESIAAESNEHVCAIEFLVANDWQIAGCAEGESVRFSIATSHGVYHETVAIKDGFEIHLPAPKHYTVAMTGDRPWPRTTVRAEDEAGRQQVATLDLVDSETAAWHAELYPGDFLLHVKSGRDEPLVVRLTLAGDLKPTINVATPTSAQIWVVDAQAAPVTNAYIAVWRGAELETVMLSGGQLPTELRAVKLEDLRVQVIDPRRGSGSAIGSAGKDRVFPERIVLDQTIGDEAKPPNAVERTEIEKLLGVTSVARDRGWMFDVTSGTRGDEVGLERGDLFVMAYEREGRVHMVIWRGDYFEVSFDSSLPATDK